MPWESDFFPQWLWDLMTNLGLLAAVVAVLSAIVWLWKRGPALLIKYGSQRFSEWGHRWDARRS